MQPWAAAGRNGSSALEPAGRNELTFPTKEAKVLEQLEDVFKADKQKDGE